MNDVSNAYRSNVVLTDDLFRNYWNMEKLDFLTKQLLI